MEENLSLVKSNNKNLYFAPWEIVKKSNYLLYFFIGGRGIGKTYDTLRGLLLDFEGKFIYLRRSENELEFSTSPESNPFKVINNDFQKDFRLSKEGKSFIIAEYEEDRKINTKGLCLSLSKVGGIRGTSFEDYDYIFFDEFISMNPVRSAYDKKQGKLLFDFLETCNRNREIGDKEPIKCILCSNAESLNNDILNFWGLIDKIYNMKINDIEFLRLETQGIYIHLPKNLPISEKKAKSRLYKSLPLENKYKEMAINNEFYNENFNDIMSFPSNVLEPLFSFKEYYFYTVKNNSVIYVSNRKHNRNRFSNFDELKKKLGINIIMFNKRLVFQNYDLKIHYKNLQ